ELDVRVREGSGRQYDVEMQCARPLALAQRALFYWARMYGAELGVGARYAELQPCIGIWFLAYPELDTERFHSRYRVLETSDFTVFSGDLELHLVELPKLAGALARGDEPRLLAWSTFLAAASDAELERLAMSDPDLREAKEALERVSSDERARVTAQARELALISRQLDLTYARKAGLEEGEERGRREGEERGRREGQREAVLMLCELLGIPVDERRRSAIDRADDRALAAILATLRTERAWPPDLAGE
ncbi:MAG: Rpn family recombination-promoting nuclease/putative transposase, partial [Polyangiaceae bacterium]|nr:Rpn family recombination-promoting nuclease/putative transposase [Polyangiaceae bacterium]